MEGYKVTIKETDKELTVKEKIKLKDMTDAIGLDETSETCEQQGIDLIIDVAGYAVLSVHNEYSDHKDYCKYMIIAKDGTKYTTGSESFWASFKDIYDEVKEGGETEFSIKVYRKESKNYKGKQFITCSII